MSPVIYVYIKHMSTQHIEQTLNTCNKMTDTSRVASWQTGHVALQQLN